MDPATYDIGTFFFDSGSITSLLKILLSGSGEVLRNLPIPVFRLKLGVAVGSVPPNTDLTEACQNFMKYFPYI